MSVTISASILTGCSVISIKYAHSDVSETEIAFSMSSSVSEAHVAEENVQELGDAMWDYLMEQYHNPVAASAIMANARAESSLVPYRLSNDVEPDETGEYPYSKAYTEKIDSGELLRDYFVFSDPNFDSYGLFCWYGTGRKGALYDFAKARGVSVSDWKMQLDFAYQEIIERYYGLYTILMTETDLKKATDAFMMIFEQASSADLETDKRALFAAEFYNKYQGFLGFTLDYTSEQMLPVNQSFDYLKTVTISKNTRKSDIYTYMMQIGLKSLGYPVGDPEKGANGFYGEVTEESVRQFQDDNGLEVTGVFTPNDWAVLAKLTGINLEK